MLAGLSGGLTRTAWYASPKQNWRRLRTRIGRPSPSSASNSEDVLARTLNDRLQRDGLIDQPLSASRLLDLVDPHARHSDQTPGFDAVQLLHDTLADYDVLRLISYDYLGQAGRRTPTLRHLADTAIRTVLPRHGSLFSWLIRKPVERQGDAT